MTATTKKSANPAYPDADPTAPGGMSRAALRVELAEKHGVSMEESASIKWPVLIDMVVQGRLDREREAKTGSAIEDYDHADYYGAPDLDADDMFPSEDDALDEDEVPDHAKDCAWILHDEECTCGADEMLAEYDETESVGFDGPHPDDAVAEPEAAEDDDTEIFDPETLFAEIVAEQEAERAANPPIFLPIPGIKDYVYDGHAGAGPSASERWMTCTMSLSASKAFLETLSPNQLLSFAGANLAARQGTTAHAVGEAKANHMLGKIDDEELSTTLLDLSLTPEEGEEYNDEMDEYVNEYVDLIKSYADERGAENILIEQRVSAAIPLADMHDDEVYIINGSADAIGLPTEDDPVLVVADLKYGEGLYVEATANSQAMIYSLGVLDLLVDEDGNLTMDIEKVRIYIAQPRLGGIKVWELTLDELLDWRDDVLSPALTKALYGEREGATFNPTPNACQFCPARGACPALAEQRVAQAAEAFEVIVEAEFNEGPGAFPETTTLPSDRLASLLDQIGGLVNIYKDLKEEAQRRLHRGEEVPGFMLVNYTPPRKWKEGAEDKLPGALRSKVLREQLFTVPSLVTPTQAEKILGENYAKIEALVDRPAKRPVVAPEGDRRSRWEGRPPEAMFDDESTDEDRVRAVEEMFPDE
jgi:hypothetical protein